MQESTDERKATQLTQEVPTAVTQAESATGPLSARADVASRGRNLLMFSGGRDSTLAAMRMHAQGATLALVTVTSSHLVGMDRVRTRLSELAMHLPDDTPWFHVRQPTELRTDTSFYEQTCLACHHAYVAVSGSVARTLSASRLAFGYAGYQKDWPEQSLLAISCLRGVLARHGIELVLPVYDIPSKAAAIAELEALGLNSAALEQKCLQQITNVVLSDERLRQQVGLWEAAIDGSMSKISDIEVDVVERRTLGEFR